MIKFSTGEKTPIVKTLISKTFFLLEIPHIMFWQQRRLWNIRCIFSSFGQIADLSQHVPPLWSIKENSSKMFESPSLSLSVINDYISLYIVMAAVSRLRHSTSSSLIWGSLKWKSPIFTITNSWRLRRKTQV